MSSPLGRYWCGGWGDGGQWGGGGGIFSRWVGWAGSSRRLWTSLCPCRTRTWRCPDSVLRQSGGLFRCAQRSCLKQRQQQQYNLGRLRFYRRGASTPLWGFEACSHPSRRPNPIPAIPPYVIRTPHLHGAPTTEETVKLWY